MSATLAPATQCRHDVPPGCPLSRREFELIEAIADGLTYRAIARKWHVSLSTVKATAHSAYGRLGGVSGPEAVAHCFRQGWLGRVGRDLTRLAAAVDRLTRAVASEEKSTLTAEQRSYLHAFEDYLYARTDGAKLAARRRMDLTARTARITPHPERGGRELMDTLVMLTRRGWR